ncbi:MAG: hypothetical protein LC733_09870 [Actinobacteria bacterium]|nr:hypothetical protein [Actinomycetota bacterium]
MTEGEPAPRPQVRAARALVLSVSVLTVARTMADLATANVGLGRTGFNLGASAIVVHVGARFAVLALVAHTSDPTFAIITGASRATALVTGGLVGLALALYVVPGEALLDYEAAGSRRRGATTALGLTLFAAATYVWSRSTSKSDPTTS